jgi:hypothetical protein
MDTVSAWPLKFATTLQVWMQTVNCHIQQGTLKAKIRVVFQRRPDCPIHRLRFGSLAR